MRTLDLGEARDTGHRLAFSPDGTFAVGCDRQRGLVKVWDVPAWTERHVLNVPLVNRVCVSPDSTRIACVSADVRVIDARSGRTLQRFEGPEDQLNGVAFLPGGQFLVTDGGSGSALVVWDLNDGGRLVRTIGPINAVFDLAAAGNLLVSARERKRGIAGTVDVVDLAWAREYRTLSDELAPMRERLRSNAGDAVALHAYGQWYAFRGAWRWAAKLLQRAREGGQEVDPVLLATCRLRIGDVPGARAEFAAAETRPPAAVGASVPNPAATAALLSKRLDTLVRTPSPMVPAADPGFDAHLTRGFELLAGGAYAEADRAFAAAAALRPERDEAVRHARTRIDLHRATGIADKRGGDLAEAERLAAGVAARYPQDLDAQAAVGWVHYRAGRFANAVEHLGRAVGLLGERDGDRYVLRERFGDTLWRVGRRPEAIATWRRQLDGMGRDGSHHVVRLRAKLATAEAGGDPELAPTAQEREKLRPLNLPPRKPGDPDA
jgi:tetratricopeptide (TPR) repeat protein